LPGEEHAPEAREFVGTTRLEAFSDGVFAIAITLLVLDLTIPESGPALDRVLDAWPFYLAYVVSFLPVIAVYGLSILIGLALPAVAVALFCAIAVLLVVPFGALGRLFVRRA
jgi:hypothetical protein